MASGSTSWRDAVNGNCSLRCPAVVGSDGRERLMRWRRPFDLDLITRVDDAASRDDAHDPGLADDCPVHITLHGDLQEVRAEAVDLGAGASQPRDADDGLTADVQQGVPREAE